MSIFSMLTEATCGEACWQAREDVCRCSCGGKNHGCLRTADGTRPERSAKIDGLRYVLKATAADNARTPEAQAARHELYDKAETLNNAFGTEKFRSWDTNIRHAPARIRNATKSQLAAWPELASYREKIEAIKQAGNYCQVDLIEASPQLLWIREDIADAPQPVETQPQATQTEQASLF